MSKVAFITVVTLALTASAVATTNEFIGSWTACDGRQRLVWRPDGTGERILTNIGDVPGTTTYFFRWENAEKQAYKLIVTFYRMTRIGSDNNFKKNIPEDDQHKCLEAFKIKDGKLTMFDWTYTRE